MKKYRITYRDESARWTEVSADQMHVDGATLVLTVAVKDNVAMNASIVALFPLDAIAGIVVMEEAAAS